ncbi:MAG: CvpA family protein [Cyclobacteriaceae bacterium]
MGTVDIILLVLLLFGAFKGYTQGLIVEVLSFIAFFLGLFLALELTLPVSKSLFGSTGFFELGSILIFIALFVLLSLLIKAGAKAIKSVVDLTLLGTLDNLLGAIAGVFKWAFLISVIFWVADSVGIDLSNRFSDDAVVLPYIIGIGPMVFEWISVLIPIIRDLMDSMENLNPGRDSVLTILTQSS